VTAPAINNEGHIAGFVSNGGNDEGFLQEGNKVESLKGPAGAVSVISLGVNNRGSGGWFIHRRKRHNARIPV
jgi:hypothetical protein